MLTLQGWSEGKGLGVNEQGITENIKAKKIIEKRGTFTLIV
ncbi:MAG: hypothetical protein JST59_02295 [Actinobacteria bacterium]|nr:hypothetical protein [Actinomycetota bacterium]